MASKTTKIELSKTNQFSDTFLDYINGGTKLQSFYNYAPVIESFVNAIADTKQQSINRELLVSVLIEQYQPINNKSLQLKCIDSLLDKNTFTVCTGHQLCLFTGPLYFIFKIISTINLAKKLKQHYPEFNFVPIYWMASEDHDFEEIKSINLFGKKISWNNELAKGSVGRLSTASLRSVVDELKQILGESANAMELVELFETAYLKQNDVASATRYLVHQLFVTEELVIVDGNDKRLKAAFSNIIEDDLFNNTNHLLVNKSIEELETIGAKTQVNPREINCFYMVDNLRERIEKRDNDSFAVLNTSITFTKETLLQELNNFPERFSPNVVLRPLYQQQLLPNLAYIGGPNELLYWLEYKRMFEYHKINFPVLIPRNFAILTDERTSMQIQKLGFSLNDLFKELDVLIKEFITKNASSELSLKTEEHQLIELYKQITAKVSSVDASLKATVEAEMQKTVNAFKNIETKLMRAEKQKQEVNLNQIKKLKERFFPNNSLQERFDTMAPYYLKSGKLLMPLLMDVFDPLEFNMQIVEL